MEIALALGGLLIGWIIAHVYYVKANASQKALFDKLSADLRRVILSDPREQLSVRELNELLEARTVDPTSNEPLPYKACPKCGSADLGHSSATDYVHDEVYYSVTCASCGWGEWSQ